MKRTLVLLSLIVGLQAWAVEIPTVPNSIEFAGLNLKLTDKARKKIQAEVNALTRNPKYFQIKVDRLQIYFPIIERVFTEEGLPEDFKYLVLQESALISDAVSSSNAVGFWQFKKAAATEVGLRVDRNIDERLNIVSSTRGAAKYLKKNNRIYFDNWVHALLAYQQGPGGAQKLVNKKYRGSGSMPIDSRTHWYVIKFLAHKIAFEQVKSAAPKLYLIEYYEGQGQTIKEISDQKQMDPKQLQKYNKWLRRGKVPSDKPYAVILPYEDKSSLLVTANNSKVDPQAEGNFHSAAKTRQYQTHPTRYPIVQSYKNTSKGVKINGIRGIRLKDDMDLASLEGATGVSIKRLLYYNDLKRNKQPQAGELWYLKPKKSKAKVEYHVVLEGEDLWSISQKYGLKLSQLRKKNRMSKRQNSVKPGRVLWLQAARSAGEPIAFQLTENPGTTKSPAAKTTAKVTSSTAVKPDKPVKPTTFESSETGNKAPINNPDKDEVLDSIQEPQLEKLPKTTQKVHVVVQGETLYGISKKYAISLTDIMTWNELDDQSVLGIGQRLKISNEASSVSKETATEPEVQKTRDFDTQGKIRRDPL